MNKNGGNVSNNVKQKTENGKVEEKASFQMGGGTSSGGGAGRKKDKELLSPLEQLALTGAMSYVLTSAGGTAVAAAPTVTAAGATVTSGLLGAGTSTALTTTGGAALVAGTGGATAALAGAGAVAAPVVAGVVVAGGLGYIGKEIYDKVKETEKDPSSAPKGNPETLKLRRRE